MRLSLPRQLSVLAPAFGLHTALISRVTLRVPPLGDLYLEDAIGAAAALWLAPRCVPPLAALAGRRVCYISMEIIRSWNMCQLRRNGQRNLASPSV